MSKPFDIIFAADEAGGIGLNGDLPWRQDSAAKSIMLADMRMFKTITMYGNNPHVIMGRCTWDSIPQRHRPLPGRTCIVISRSVLELTGAIVVRSLDEALGVSAKRTAPGDSIVVMGGAAIYAEAARHPQCRYIIKTTYPGTYRCDRVFTPSGWYCVRVNDCHDLSDPVVDAINGAKASGLAVNVYSRDTPERQYQALLQELLAAPCRPSRTGIGCRSVFVRALRWPLLDGERPIMPILTTKRVNYRAAFAEMLWFLQGATDVEYLHRHGVHIWDGNSSREYLDSRGLFDLEVGQTGPIYGKQWRNWGGDEDTPGIDQIQLLVDGLRADPFGRRHVVSAWNPADIDKMCLPPCHYSFQMYVNANPGDPQKKYLSTHVVMRSADVFLAAGSFNVCGYGLLTYIIGALTGYIPAEVVITMTDCHLYETHVEVAQKQLLRQPRPFPSFELPGWVKQVPDPDIDMFAIMDPADFIVRGYIPHGRLRADMAV